MMSDARVSTESEAGGHRSVLVVIPAWNEADVIGPVLEDVRRHLPAGIDVLVVSDGSTDQTAQIARDSGVKVLDLPLNLGVGGAMRAGYHYAHRHGYTHVIQLDADGQHDPRDVPVLLDEAKGGADIVIGSRFAGTGEYDVKGLRKLAMVVLSTVLSRVCHTKLTDTTSGFKLYGPRALELFWNDYPAEYLGDTIEALVMAARADLAITEVGVTMHPRAGGQASHDALRSAIHLLRALLALAVALSRPRRSVRTETTAQGESGEELR